MKRFVLVLRWVTLIKGIKKYNFPTVFTSQGGNFTNFIPISRLISKIIKNSKNSFEFLKYQLDIFNFYLFPKVEML